MVMIIVWAVSWWYGAGWLRQLARIKEQLASAYDYFSISILLRTLFAPFRQISASGVDGPVGVKIRAFVDKLISRIIGACVRIILIFTGIVWMSLLVLVGIILLVGWAFIPFMPLIGFIVMLSGWMPV